MVNRTERLLARLPEFMRKDIDSNNYKLLSSFAPEFDTLADERVNLKNAIKLSTAQDSDLDDIGTLFLLPRKGAETDGNYRSRIKSYWQGFKGGGTNDSITSAIANALDLDESEVIITETSPLKFTIVFTLDISDAELITSAIDIAQATKAAGTYVLVNAVVEGLDEGMVFSDTAGSPTANLGLYIETSLIDGDDLIG